MCIRIHSVIWGTWCVCVSVNWSSEKLYSQDVEEDVEGELTRLNQKEHQKVAVCS